MSRFRGSVAASISLFPFLAVLLCTMGALLVLLVLFSRSASRQEETLVDEAAREELQLARENLAWRIDQLRAIRDKTAVGLEQERLRLAGVEEHTRALTAELDSVLDVVKSLDADTGKMVVPAAEMAELEERLKSARESLAKARAEQAKRPPAYAVIPYVGAAGTHRRPLYIECCIDGVFLQPEGIRLTPADFEGPPGPGNPLASGLRAAREYLASRAGPDDDPGVQPYPLLLVRPSGVMAYYSAREAIASWGSDFGYQLIDEDWTIAFPPRDPALAEVEKVAIGEARQRLEWLAQTRSVARQQTRPSQQFRAATTRGGVVPDGGPSVLGDQSRWEWSRQQAEHAARGAGDTVGPGRGFGSGTGGGDTILGSGGIAQGAAGGLSGGAATAGSVFAGTAPGGLPSGAGATVGTMSTSALPTGGAGGQAGAAGSVAAAAAGALPGVGGTNEGSFTGGGGPSGAAGFGDQEAPVAAGDASGIESNGEGGAGGSGAAGMAQTAGGGGGFGGPSMPGLLQPQATVQARGGAASGEHSGGMPGGVGSMAQSRGQNWASLATAERFIPLTRPIQVECAAEEFRLLDDAGRRVSRRITIGERTVDAVDPLVAAVQKRVEAWGIAGDRLYWRPELILVETPGGGQRRDELEQLLAGSGLDTRRKGSDGEIRRLPPVRPRTAAAVGSATATEVR
jgi:hypothetical protein